MKLEQAYAALRFDPALPWAAYAVLAGLCALALLPALVRRARGAWWRALAFCVLLVWLAGPRLVQETRDTLPDIGLLVVDETASMQVSDRAALRDAIEDARELVVTQGVMDMSPENHNGFDGRAVVMVTIQGGAWKLLAE